MTVGLLMAGCWARRHAHVGCAARLASSGLLACLPFLLQVADASSLKVGQLVDLWFKDEGSAFNNYM